MAKAKPNFTPRASKSAQSRAQSAARKAAQQARGGSKFGESNPHNGASISQSKSRGQIVSRTLGVRCLSQRTPQTYKRLGGHLLISREQQRECTHRYTKYQKIMAC